jgi:hypothetical protein
MLARRLTLVLLVKRRVGVVVPEEATDAVVRVGTAVEDLWWARRLRRFGEVKRRSRSRRPASTLSGEGAVLDPAGVAGAGTVVNIVITNLGTNPCVRVSQQQERARAGGAEKRVQWPFPRAAKQNLRGQSCRTSLCLGFNLLAGSRSVDMAISASFRP